MNGAHPNYDHMHSVIAGQLPLPLRTEGRTVTRGYAVGLSGQLPQAWAFFDHIKPPTPSAGPTDDSGRRHLLGPVRGRQRGPLGRIRWDEDELRDVRTLYVTANASLREDADGQDLIARWARGTNPRCFYFQPPGSEQALPDRRPEHHVWAPPQ